MIARAPIDRSDIAAFLHARQSATLCCDPVADWLARFGHLVDTPFEARARIWREGGALEYCVALGCHLGLAETREPQPGDVALVRLNDRVQALGIIAGPSAPRLNPMTALLEAASRRVVIGRLPIAAAWSVPACRP
jgi:hypothetical protein